VIQGKENVMDKPEKVKTLGSYRPPFDQIIAALDNAAAADVFNVAVVEDTDLLLISWFESPCYQ
jgi:hypothetical protein